MRCWPNYFVLLSSSKSPPASSELHAFGTPLYKCFDKLWGNLWNMNRISTEDYLSGLEGTMNCKSELQSCPGIEVQRTPEARFLMSVKSIIDILGFNLV